MLHIAPLVQQLVPSSWLSSLSSFTPVCSHRQRLHLLRTHTSSHYRHQRIPQHPTQSRRKPHMVQNRHCHLSRHNRNQSLHRALRGKETKQKSRIRQLQNSHTCDNPIDFSVVDFVSYGIVACVWGIQEFIDNGGIWVRGADSGGVGCSCLGAEFDCCGGNDVLFAAVQVDIMCCGWCLW